MGCLFEFSKGLIIFFIVAFVLVFGVAAIFIDMIHVVDGKDPYFFDPEEVKAYDEPIFVGVLNEMDQHYNKYREEIRSVEREMNFLPDNRSLSVEFIKGSKISLSVGYRGGSKFQTPFDYKAEDNQEFMMKIGLTSDKLDKLKRKVLAANCISFEKKKGIRLGFVDKKAGTFHYRFKSNSPEDINTLLDSCLIKRLNDDVLVEYTGLGRGPDCIKSENSADFDDRSFFRKWFDLLKEGKMKSKEKGTAK